MCFIIIYIKDAGRWTYIDVDKSPVIKSILTDFLKGSITDALFLIRYYQLHPL